MDHPPLSIEGESLFLFIIKPMYCLLQKKLLYILIHQKTGLYEVYLSDLKPLCYHFSDIHLCHHDQYCFDFKIKYKIIKMKC